MFGECKITLIDRDNHGVPPISPRPMNSVQTWMLLFCNFLKRGER